MNELQPMFALVVQSMVLDPSERKRTPENLQ